MENKSRKLMECPGKINEEPKNVKSDELLISKEHEDLSSKL